MSEFADLLAVTADVAIDALYGESFTVTPQARKQGDPNARRVAPAGLAPVTFEGVWDDPRTKVYPHNDEGHRDSATQRIGAGAPKVDYQLSVVPYPIQKGYGLVRAKDGSRYEVADITDDGLTRAILSLTAEKKA